MRKKIFTLLTLSFLLGGILTSVNAQVVNSVKIYHQDTTAVKKNWPGGTVDTVALYHDTLSINQSKVFSGCTQTLEIKVSPAPTTDSAIFVVLEAPDYIDLPDSFKIAKGDSIYKLTFYTDERPIGDNGKSDSIVAYIGNSTKAKVNKNFYNTPTYKLDYSKPTSLSDGWLKLNIVGGSKELLRSTNEGLTWKLASDPFSKIEVANLDEFIYLKEPNSCNLIAIEINKTYPPSIFHRTVIIKDVESATIKEGTGVHYVTSGSNFHFTIIPSGDNISKVPQITTDRTTISDKDGVSVIKNEDGSFTAWIYDIKSPVNIDITFVTGNEDVALNEVWANNGQIYISAVNSGNAQIFNSAGKLVKNVKFAAGEISSIDVPAGFYVALINGKAQKVFVK